MLHGVCNEMFAARSDLDVVGIQPTDITLQTCTCTTSTMHNSRNSSNYSNNKGIFVVALNKVGSIVAGQHGVFSWNLHM